jgi:hypothetical protein
MGFREIDSGGSAILVNKAGLYGTDFSLAFESKPEA